MILIHAHTHVYSKAYMLQNGQIWLGNSLFSPVAQSFVIL